MQKKSLRLGISDYKQFLEENGYFVDKTMLIQEVIDCAYQTPVIPRPRRFGKTFNLSMLRYFFDARLKDTAQLFEPYKIWQAGDYYTQKQGKYPVIHLSLKKAKGKTFEECCNRLFGILTEVYRNNAWLLEEGNLSSFNKEEFLSILKGTASPTIYEASLQKLSQYLYNYFQEKVLVLIDEYDAPIHVGFYNGYYSDIIGTMKALLGNVLKDNTYLYRGVVTGILRISKESIFSDINNIGVYTLLNYDFADKFGFTESETQTLLQYFDLEHQFPQVKAWYDGYQMGNVSNIYNPWSVVNYAARYEEGFQAYWVNTSSDELIKRQINARDAGEIRQDIEKLIKGKTIVKSINPNIVFSEWEEDIEILWSLLVFSGYLMPVNYTTYQEEHELKIPNYEIKTLFKKIVLDWLRIYVKIRYNTLRAMTQSLVNNKITAFKKHFKKVMGDTFSYFDINTEPERVYQAYVLGLLGMLGDDYIIKSNKETGKGRYDILLLPHKKSAYGIIIEIKTLGKNAKQKNIEAKLTEALGQIHKNQYYKELIAHQINNRIEMAIVFAGKEEYIDVN